MSGSIELGLERIHSLLSHYPPYTRPTIHIAGTNGKGSVSALLTSIFVVPVHEKTASDSESDEFKVGRFNSPHLVTVRDSITINNVPIAASIFHQISLRVHSTNTSYSINASPFELLAATALVIFECQKVDLTILEVGMGGRLDATNIIPTSAVVLSIITSIDLDHQAFLGDTVQAIAREKAGIVRDGGLVVMSPQQHGETAALIIRDVAKAKKAQLVEARPAKEREWDDEVDGLRVQTFSLNPISKPAPRPVQMDEFLGENPFKLQLPLHGEHQLSNLGTALSAISMLCDANLAHFPSLKLRVEQLTRQGIRAGVLNCTWPGRLSFHTYQSTAPTTRTIAVIADGAHNAGASELLSSYISSLLAQLSRNATATKPVSLTYILALSHSPPKTPASVLNPLLALDSSQFSALDVRVGVAALRFTPPEGMPWVASVRPSEIAAIVSSSNPAADIWAAPDTGTNEGALKEALEWAAKRGHDEADSLVLVAGSLYLVADFYRLVGLQA